MTAFMQLAPSSLKARQGDPTIMRQAVNFIVFEAAWFAAVLGAAHEVPLLGTIAVAIAVAWHVAISARPAVEARLVGIVCVIGFAAESLRAVQGDIAFTSGQTWPGIAPYWMVALWGLLAIALNVTMRWMKGRWWLAAAVGCIAGPLSFVSGVRLGAAQFLDTTSALVSLSVMWAVLLPLLMWLSVQFDGVATEREQAVDD